MMTIARPALKATPTLSLVTALRTVSPSPGAPISAQMVTIERAAIMVWLIPRTIVFLAIGSWT